MIPGYRPASISPNRRILDTVTILWPAPKKFEDGAGGLSLGYVKQVVLPMRVIAKDPGKPVILRAAINYAVCDKLCIPVDANAELAFTSVASTEDGALTAALDTVPKPATMGDTRSADGARPQARGQECVR